EKLLQWVIREELPKGRRVDANPWDAVTQYGALGTRIDVSSHGGFSFVPGEPDDDALAVAAAIKQLDRSATILDPDDAIVLFGDIAPIAGDAVRLVMEATYDLRALVISFAVRGARPDWEFDHPQPFQRFAPSSSGRARALVYGIDRAGDLIEVRRNSGRALKRDGEYPPHVSPRSPIDWLNPSPIEIAESRAEYFLWHGALVTLAADLAGKLTSHDCLPPSVPALPWLTAHQNVCKKPASLAA
ncbi:MAG: hypothetical protein JSS22_04715, partial [Proteobacteria bacterium]|nr:hypothetical protein [Pseudomonadota bacterium]